MLLLQCEGGQKEEGEEGEEEKKRRREEEKGEGGGTRPLAEVRGRIIDVFLGQMAKRCSDVSKEGRFGY